jgi:redox-sensitive bicupin YhaK (pirin superfamily)
VTSIAGLTYTWTLPAGGSVLSGQGTAAISAKWGTVAGSVSVVASNTCGNSSARTLAVALAACRLEVEEEANETVSPEVSVYPNPGTGRFNVKTTGLSDGDQLVIFDMLGKKVLQKTFESDSQEFEINLLDVPSGAYIFKVEGKNFTKHLKVVKK